jgi:hypothetical protein
MLNSTHPVSDMLDRRPPRCGYTKPRELQMERILQAAPEVFLDECFARTRPRTTGYSPGHVRSLAQTESRTRSGSDDDSTPPLPPLSARERGQMWLVRYRRAAQVCTVEA